MNNKQLNDTWNQLGVDEKKYAIASIIDKKDGCALTKIDLWDWVAKNYPVVATEAFAKAHPSD